MKKIKGIRGLVIGIVVMSLMLASGAAFAADQMTAINKDFSNISETEAMSKLAQNSFEEIINDINILSNNVEMSDLIFHANALAEKAKEVPQEQISKEILNENNTDTTRVILTQIYRHIGGDGNNQELLALLEEKDVDFEIKRNILLNVYQTAPNDSQFYEKIALGEDDRLAFHAIKILNETNPKLAMEISDAIIENFDGTVTEKMRAAVKVKGSQLSNSSSKDELQEFINLCDSMLTNASKEDDIVADTVIFALSDVMSTETISYIIASDKVDNVVKTYCIDQNYSVLAEMISDNPTKSEIEIVSRAMSIYPITKMAEPLQVVLASQEKLSSTESQELVKEIQATLDFISKNGLNLTGKY